MSKNVFISCGSSNLVDRCYDDVLLNFTKYLYDNGYSIVTGNSSGVMLNVKKKYGLKMNFIDMVVLNYQDTDDSSLVFTNIFDRKKELFNMADIMIVFPGGFGTIDEFFSAIECKRAGEFNMPIVLYNYNNYYDNIIKFIDKMYSEKFANINDSNNYIFVNNYQELIDYMEEVF